MLPPPVEPAKHDSCPVAAGGSAAGRQYAGTNEGGGVGVGVWEGVAVAMPVAVVAVDADAPALPA